MSFETAIIRFHYQGSLVGTGEDLIYEGGFVDELQFDPDRIGYYNLINICERARYQNVHKMWYNRPGFKLVDGIKEIRDDASILDMVGEMYVNDGVIDVFIEHFVHEPEVIVGLIENGPLEDGENGPLEEGENLPNGYNGENLVDVNVNENVEAVNVDQDQEVEVEMEQVNIDVRNLQQGDDQGFEDEEEENESVGVGPSAAGPSRAGPSAAGPSHAGPSNAGPSNASQPIGGEDYSHMDQVEETPITQHPTAQQSSATPQPSNEVHSTTPSTRKKAGRTTSSTNVSVNISLAPSPQISADMASKASSTPTGNVEASGSVEVPRQESGSINAACLAKVGSKKRKRNPPAAKKKTRFTVVDGIGNMHNVSGERSSPASQAKYADCPPVTATSLQRDAQKKFKARMEALKIREETQGEVSRPRPNKSTSSRTNHSTQEGLGSSGSSKGKEKI
ncbi:hypothetical protein COLO4_32795 [Corchorus olitorius]|uniref:PB1-like domain-containing protein n=1 Tax=Corchorus olitorius TaxID=93759 RepID=A0A1R3GXW6_9ROSI|nr:hypothetical protein COLO4_32795 [Corchorus olitorius]